MRMLCLVTCIALLTGSAYAELDVDRNPFLDPPPDDGSTPPAPLAGRFEVFDNEADFLNAAGNVTTLDFEAEATTGDCESGAALELVFADFTVASAPAAMKVLDAPCAGNHNTTPGGVKYLSADTDLGGMSAEVTFTFNTPIRTLGFYIIDLDVATAQLVILGSSYTVEPHGDAGQTFFGIIEDVEFTSVVVQIIQEFDSHYSFDDISYGPGLTPVEDTTWGVVKALYR